MSTVFVPIEDLDSIMLDYSELPEYKRTILPEIPKTIEEIRNLLNTETKMIESISTLSKDSIIEQEKIKKEE